jgi:hypothetical protein
MSIILKRNHKWETGCEGLNWTSVGFNGWVLRCRWWPSEGVVLTVASSEQGDGSRRHVLRPVFELGTFRCSRKVRWLSSGSSCSDNLAAKRPRYSNAFRWPSHNGRITEIWGSSGINTTHVVGIPPNISGMQPVYRGPQVSIKGWHDAMAAWLTEWTKDEVGGTRRTRG